MIPSNKKDNPHAMEDNACALENIFLAAHSFGVGSVWINQLRDVCEEKGNPGNTERLGDSR